MSAESPTSHILQALVANLVIASVKGAGAWLTGSGAMLAETLHSGADCGNQLLLLLGVKRARRPPDAKHPLGYGRALYFWSFIVSLLLFTGGGIFSIYEGVHKLLHPEPIGRIWIALLILGLSIAIEGAATGSNIRELNRRRDKTPFFRFLRETKDSDLVVIFGENAAATLGLLLALGALLATRETGDSRWDGVGSLAIGLVLVGVATFLAVEIKSLLVGEAADPRIARAVRELVADEPRIESLLELIALQQGPGQVVVAAKVRLAPTLTTLEVCRTINAFEAALRARCPEVKWSFIEPDATDEGAEPVP
jgi:cation diffusion facilitator family transporter